MGPRLFRRGNMPGTAPAVRLLTRFNGATSFQTWKLEDFRVMLQEDDVLQWGHVFSDVETRSRAQ